MKYQSKCDGGIELNDPEVKNLLLQNKGGFNGKFTLPDGKQGVVTIKWNKKELFFACSIAFLKKQKDGKLHCEARFDDAHGSRHFDADFPFGKTKMFGGDFTEIKTQCPILIQIIKSLPKDRADAWKIKLFEEIVLGNKRRLHRQQ